MEDASMPNRIWAGIVVACTAMAPLPAAAWDYPGHRIVGAIADLVLQHHEPATYKRVSELLEIQLPNGLWQKRTLREVAVFPDCAKPNNVAFCGRPPSEEEKAYAERNKHHGSYHFTDVPLQQTKYVADSAGTNDIDVVQMIAYAVTQLRGKTPPAKKDVKLTDTEAVWLLAHLVGDIHEPLHVGARYFDKSCDNAVDPNVGGVPPKFGIGDTIASTVGGNLIALLAPFPAVPLAENLHFYWDSAAVVEAMQSEGVGQSEQDFARSLAGAPPSGWETAGPPETWAMQWASESLPLAAEALGRLTIRKTPQPFPACGWTTTIDASYEDWAKAQAKIQLAKAGVRLAALLKTILPPQ
jgi:S1/P1 nuclease